MASPPTDGTQQASFPCMPKPLSPWALSFAGYGHGIDGCNIRNMWKCTNHTRQKFFEPFSLIKGSISPLPDDWKSVEEAVWSCSCHRRLAFWSARSRSISSSSWIMHLPLARNCLNVEQSITLVKMSASCAAL